MVVVGDPGVGKSTLLDDAVESAGGFLVLRTTGFEMESDLPFAGLSAILAPVANIIPTIPAPQAAALTGALGLGDPAPAGDRFTVYAGALSVLAEAALKQPLLVIVDDGHWVDPASVDALCFVARRIVAEGIMILMASRDDPTTLLRRAGGLTQLRLEGLSGDAAAELVAGTAGRIVSASTVARLIAETGGNPLMSAGARHPGGQRLRSAVVEYRDRLLVLVDRHERERSLDRLLATLLVHLLDEDVDVHFEAGPSDVDDVGNQFDDGSRRDRLVEVDLIR